MHERNFDELIVDKFFLMKSFLPTKVGNSVGKSFDLLVQVVHIDGSSNSAILCYQTHFLLFFSYLLEQKKISINNYDGYVLESYR